MTAKNDITGDELRSRALSDQGKENYDKIFGNKKPQKGSWVWDSSQGKLVEKFSHKPESKQTHHIFVDNMEAYESPITGEVVKNRRQRDIVLKQSGSRPYEGFKTESQEAERWRNYQDEKLNKNMRETMERTLYEVNHGYRKLD